jgi:hypothetical protein
MKTLAVFDIDMTLGESCYEGTSGAVEDNLPGGFYESEKLYAQVPFWQMVPVVRAVAEDPETFVMFLTGRKHHNHEATQEWLARVFLVDEPIVLLRPDDLPHGEIRAWKMRTLLNQWKLGSYDQVLLYDDDDFWVEALNNIKESPPPGTFYLMEEGWLVSAFQAERQPLNSEEPEL